MLSIFSPFKTFTNGLFEYQASIELESETILLECLEGGSLSWDLTDYNLELVNEAILELKSGYNNPDNQLELICI